MKSDKREPDFGNLLKVLAREVPARPTLFELFLNAPLYRKAVGPAMAARIESGPDPDLALRVQGFRALGYDYATLNLPNFRFPRAAQAHAATISLNDGGMIADRASFDRYDWPEPDAADYAALDRLSDGLPARMKLIVMGPCGVLENAVGIVGYETLCYLLLDDPALVSDLFEAIGSRLTRYYERAVRHERVGAIIANDDWGFKTQPMLTPEQMREHVVPWHRAIVATAHRAGKPAILHSCGNLESLMDDIVEDIGFDGKHSYEDAILPVEDFYERFGRRIAVLGGMDVDFLIRNPPETVAARARAMLDRAAERGGYALGTGNSVPEYLPDEQYFAMARAAIDDL